MCSRWRQIFDLGRRVQSRFKPGVENHPVSPLRAIGGWCKDIFFASLVALVIIGFVIQPVKVEGNSMHPKLDDQERIFINKFVYHFWDIQRGDIVVFWYPRDPSKSFIKRVVGLPGETVEIRSGLVRIDGEALREPYLWSDSSDHTSHLPRLVPLNQYFVLGDHRRSSNDSRNWGFVPVQNIFGKATFRYWPVSRLGLID